MKERDNFIYEIIVGDLDLNINDVIPNKNFTLGELIDCSIFYFYKKFQ